MTRILEFPPAVSGSGPYMSMAILSEGVPDLTMVIGFLLVLPAGPLALKHTPHWASQLLTSARMSCQKYFSCRRAIVHFTPRWAIHLSLWACWRISFPLASRNQHLGVNFHPIRTLPLLVDDAISQYEALALPPVGFGRQTELGYFIPLGFLFSFRQPSPDRRDVGVSFLQLPTRLNPVPDLLAAADNLSIHYPTAVTKESVLYVAECIPG